MLIATAILAAAGFGCPSDALSARMHELAARARGRVGAAASVLEESPLEVVALRGTERFPMQSVYKVPIAMAVLSDVDAGRRRLDDRVQVLAGDVAPPQVWSPLRDRHPGGGFETTLSELLRASIVDSDGLACDVLLRLAGFRRIRAYLDRIPLKDVRVETTEKAMARGDRVQYRNFTTPTAAILMLRALARGSALSDASRALLLGWMTETQIGVHRIPGGLPPGVEVAHKTGTSGTHNGLTRATNDTGIVRLPDGRHLLVAIFVSDSRADVADREGVIAEIARAAMDCALSEPETRSSGR